MAIAVQLAAGFRPIDRRNFDDRRMLKVRAERDPFAPRQEPVRRPEWARLSEWKPWSALNREWADQAANIERLRSTAWTTPPSSVIRTSHRRGSTATQRVLLEYAEMRGWKFISAGINGSVYASPDGEWVYKRARRNDTTRTFLEWCLWRQQQGRGMRGMPEIDFLADCGEGYVVGMRRYSETLRHRRARGAESHVRTSYSYCSFEVPADHYLRRLQHEFESDCPGCEMNDLHDGNVMWDDRTETYILIDPSASNYTPLGSWHRPEDFQLH